MPSKVYLNPVKDDVSDSDLNTGEGGHFDTTLEMHEGAP